MISLTSISWKHIGGLLLSFCIAIPALYYGHNGFEAEILRPNRQWYTLAWYAWWILFGLLATPSVNDRARGIMSTGLSFVSRARRAARGDPVTDELQLPPKPSNAP